MGKKRKYEINRERGIFIKHYLPEEIKDQNILLLEYEKGKLLSKIINYPSPIEVNDNMISYELINIKTSLIDLLKKVNVNFSIYEYIGKNLRKMHDYNIMHGDFSPKNIIFDESDKIWFIDASFSRHNTDGQILNSVDNIYKDISLFLMHLKISKPLYKPWLFFTFQRNKKIKQHFLRGYFKNEENINKLKNLDQENYFFMRHILYRKNRGKLLDKVRIPIALFFIFINKIEKICLLINEKKH